MGGPPAMEGLDSIAHEPHCETEMKQRSTLRRAKLPPILEIDEYGLPVNERESFYRPRWSADQLHQGAPP